MADDLGFGIAFKIMGVFALAGAAAIGTAIYSGASQHEKKTAETAAVASLTTRAEDTLRNKSLTVITLDKFQKMTEACGADRPYGANFVAQDANKDIVRGRICSSPDRESTITINP